MKKLCILIACMLLLACGSDTEQSKQSESETASILRDLQATAQDRVVELATRNVSCGCTLEGIGQCGNYIEIDSRYIEIANSKDLGLGDMEWCGKSGVQAESAGKIQNGKFVAATLVTK